MFHSHSPIKIVRLFYRVMHPLPFLFLRTSDREKIRIRRAGDGKIARIAFELRKTFVLLKIARMDGWIDGKRYDPHKFLRSVDWKSLNRRG